MPPFHVPHIARSGLPIRRHVADARSRRLFRHGAAHILRFPRHARRRRAYLPGASMLRRKMALGFRPQVPSLKAGVAKRDASPLGISREIAGRSPFSRCHLPAFSYITTTPPHARRACFDGYGGGALLRSLLHGRASITSTPPMAMTRPASNVSFSRQYRRDCRCR